MGAGVGDAENHIAEDEDEHGEQHRLDDWVVAYWRHVDIDEFGEHFRSLVPFCLCYLA